MVPLCLPFCNIFLKCNLLPEFMEHFFLHAFNLSQNVSLKFLCKVHSTGCEEWEGNGHLWEQDVLFHEEGCALNLCYQPCLSSAKTRCADLCTAFLCAVLRVTRGKHMGRGSVEGGEVNVLHSGPGRGAERWPVCCVCAWPRATHWQTPLAELSAEFPRWDTCDVYC